MNKVCYTSLAFADDTAFICADKKELENTIITLQNWCDNNKIEINHKKSGILIVNGDSDDCNTIFNYPVVNEYKYLGILLNSKLEANYHISKLNNKLSDYFKKNKMLHKQYFTPFSLIRIINYFVKSRLTYGLCCFLYNRTAINKLQHTLISHLKSIFDLVTNTSHLRIQIVLGEPDIHIRLAMRLLKNYFKYVRHFREIPGIYVEILKQYYGEDFDSIESNTNMKYKTILNDQIDKNLKAIGEKYEIEIRNNHREFLKNYVFVFPDRFDYLIIKFFLKTTKLNNTRLFSVCEKCQQDNTQEHALNDCYEQKIDRIKLMRQIDEIFIRNKIKLKSNLYDYFIAIYFTIDTNKKDGFGFVKRDIRQLVKIMKDTIRTLIFNTTKL
jgi:hypothetical protein